MNNPVEPPTSPYNFVPLPDQTLQTEAPPAMYAYDATRHTGSIQLDVKAESDLYVRGIASVGAGEAGAIPFFAPGCRKLIPGSTIRGMIRTLVEVLSESAVTEASDDRMYYRNFAGTARAYVDRVVQRKPHQQAEGYIPKTRAAWFEQRPNGAVLRPCVDVENGNGVNYYRVEMKTILDAPGAPIRAGMYQRRVWYKPVPLAPERHERLDRRTGRMVPFFLWHAKVVDMSFADVADENEYSAGWLVVSGLVGHKKHLQWIVPMDTSGEIALSDEQVAEYERSTTSELERQRKAGFRLASRRAREPLPCFYLPKPDGSAEFFGHTGMFRLPYALTVLGAVPAANRAGRAWDLATAIFGRISASDSRAGRVFFEDAAYVDGDSYAQEAVQERMLQSPKPTSYNMYLTQSKQADVTWNHPQPVVRGVKFYWHRENAGAKPAVPPPIGVQREDLMTRLVPVSRGSRFSGRIRFENLTTVELGALLSALALPQGSRHRVGSAKPYGFGSILLDIKISVDDRTGADGRYRRLFSDDAWHLPMAPIPTAGECADAFAHFVLGKPGDKPAGAWERLWNLPRLRSLHALTSFDRKPAAANTDYASREVILQRTPLPLATQILDPAPPVRPKQLM